MSIKNMSRVSYRTMIILALIAGGFSIALHFMPGGELLSFMLSVAALGGLIGGSNDYNEQDRQKLRQSYKTAYEWLLLAIMIGYAFIVLSTWLRIIAGLASFLNNHWPSLILALMCLLLGMAGFQSIDNESSG